ncbi:MAG TPA: DUF1987 domain-containing protein [Bacteroidales bacterium]|nr:DUF1987 domain-containing protein [Bacteroidales bacterium]
MSVVVLHEGSKNIPRVYYDPDENSLYLTGRSITENPDIVYNPLTLWIKDHLRKYKQLNVVIFLEYINSGSSKSLCDLLRMVSTYMMPEYKVRIKWKYEEDDDSMHELGQHYRDSAGVRMEFEMVV